MAIVTVDFSPSPSAAMTDLALGASFSFVPNGDVMEERVVFAFENSDRLDLRTNMNHYQKVHRSSFFIGLACFGLVLSCLHPAAHLYACPQCFTAASSIVLPSLLILPISLLEFRFCRRSFTLRIIERLQGCNTRLECSTSELPFVQGDPSR